MIMTNEELTAKLNDAENTVANLRNLLYSAMLNNDGYVAALDAKDRKILRLTEDVDDLQYQLGKAKEALFPELPEVSQ